MSIGSSEYADDEGLTIFDLILSTMDWLASAYLQADRKRSEKNDMLWSRLSCFFQGPIEQLAEKSQEPVDRPRLFS